MSPLEFLRESQQTQLTKRSQQWWDVMSVLGGATCGYLWFVYSSVRGFPKIKFLGAARESWFDLLPSLLLVLLPFALFFFRGKIAVLIDSFMNKLPLKARIAAVISVVILGALFLFDNSLIFTQREGLSLLTPILMIGIPTCLIWFRPAIDKLLLPFQPFLRKIPPLVKVGISFAIPFAVAYVLYCMRFNQYTLLNLNIVIGTLVSHAFLRRPEAARPTVPPPGVSFSGPSAGMMLVLISMGAWLLDTPPLYADDFLRDPFNLRDGLRTNGVAEILSGLASTIVSVLVNGPELVRVLVTGGGKEMAGEPPLPPQDTAADEARKAWIEQRRNDLKAAMDMKANVEAAKSGYGGAGFDTSEHNRQIRDLENRIGELKGALAKEGAGFDYTPATQDPIGPGKEFVQAIKQNEALNEERRRLNDRLAQEKAVAKKGLAQEQDRLEQKRKEADADLNSVTGMAEDILTETVDDGAGLIKEGVTGIADGAIEIAQHPVDIGLETLKGTLKGMGQDFEQVGSTIVDLEVKLGNAEIEAAKEVYEAGKDVVEHPKIYAETVLVGSMNTVTDVKDLSTKTGEVIFEHARDHEKRNAFLKNVSGYNNFSQAMDPTNPLGTRLAHSTVGTLKVYLTAHGLAPGTVRAAAGQAVAKIATHAAAVNIEPVIEKAKEVNSALKAMGIDTGDTRNIGKIAGIYKTLNPTH